MTEFEETTLRRVLQAHAQARPAAPALLSTEGSSFNYAQLLAAADQAREGLASVGMAAGARIAVLLPAGLPLVLATVVLACNATVLPLHPSLTPLELEALLRDARVDAILGAPGSEVVAALAQKLGVKALAFDLAQGLHGTPDRPASREGGRGDPAPGDAAFVLFTSGTSGKPKRVPLTQQQVMASAHNIARHLAITPEDRGLLVMPTFHGHGLIGGLLTPLAAGSAVVCTPSFDTSAFVQWLTESDPTWYTAAPSIHQAIVDLAAERAPAWPAHRLRFTRSASSAMPTTLLRALEALWQVPVIESYGMTETSTQIASNPLSGGTRVAGSVGPAAGAQIRVIDEEERDQPSNVEGRIVVRGPAVFSGYEDAPDLSAQAFHEGWFITGDMGRLAADGYLYISGRTSELINRGGEKIAPLEVEQALLALPGVAQAVAYPAPHPTLGEDVHAAVVLARNEAADPRALRRALFGVLADFKIPVFIHLLDELPTGATGKLQRRRMHEQIQSLARTSPEATAAPQPLAPLQARIAAHFEHILRQPAASADANFLAMGGDSLSAARLALALSEEFGVVISSAQVLSAPSVSELAALAQAAIDDAAAREHDVPGTGDATRPGSPAAESTAPLLLAQEGIWFVEQLEGTGAAYNIHSSTRLRGTLDVQRLERSLHGLLARHANLRTGFHATDTEPEQRVISPSEAIERFSLRHLEVPAWEDEVARIATLVAKPFDLSQAPLLRAWLVRISQEHHVLVLIAHHIVVDGWSMTLLHRDLARLYDTDDAALPPVALAPDAYARAQREEFERGGMRAALAYWRDKLRDVQTLELPTDSQRLPRSVGNAGKMYGFRIEASVATALRALARQHQVTLFTALLAAFQALLLRYTGQTDIAIGVPVSGRDDPRLLDAVGQFVNTVVVRADLQGEPGFAELLRRDRATLFEALTHQRMPFERLVAELSPDREPGRNPLYQVSFSLENFAHRLLTLEGTRSERLGVYSGNAKFDLSLTLFDAGADADADLEGEIEYRTDLFTARSIGRMASHLRNLLAAAVAEPERPVTRLPLMDAAEQQRMLVTWNGAPTSAAPEQQGVHALFRAQARRTPGAVALRLAGETMRYGELDALSERLAHDLRGRGVVPGCVVGLCMQRSFGLVVGLLALFKAGGTYLPLDAEHPSERLEAMLADAAPRFVLADAHTADALRQLEGAGSFDIIDVPADGGAMPADAVPVVPDLALPEHVAYLIFTSGSTGMPKAAQLMHGGLANHVRWMNNTLGLSAEDRVLHKTSISFDASIWEFFSPLACGAQIVLAPPDAHRDMQQLVETLQAEAISVVQFVPSEMRVILDDARMAQCTQLRYVLCGGEALDRELALAFKRCLPGTRLGNFYGPTEATVDSAWYEVGDQVPERAVVPIGRPVANAQLYVLDAHMQPQPVNVAGELYVGGLGVGLGYLNRPDLTAQRFLPDPFRPGGRLYRTGDLARWLGEGVVEFIGRNDQQVKLRGFRIELGEIEAAVNGCRGVSMCAALLREDVPGQRQIVAYVALDGAGQADAHELRTQLRARLPEHMLPAAFVFLPQLPRMANGKIDRRKLPRPEVEVAASDQTGPRSPLEEGLHDIWSQVLGKKGFGIRTNFFDLGGHSLLATQIASRVRSLFKVDLPLRSVFENPTIEGLARVLQGHLAGRTLDDSAALAPIEVVSRAQPSVVSFSQRRIWLLHEMDPQGAAYNMCEALRLRGPLQHAALRSALDQLVARHEAFRTTFRLHHDEPRAFIGEPQPAVVVELDGRAWPDTEAELERLAAKLAAQPFDLERGPLHRFILVRLAADDHALVMVMHHVIGDGWAWSILLRELQAIYNAALRGASASLPPQAIEFIDFANWQREHIDDEVLAAQTRYWMAQLAGWTPLNLPADTAVEQRRTSRGARARLELSEAWVERLQRFSAQQNVSPFMSLLAGFQLLLSRYCGQDDVAVGTPIAGRTRVEAEELVGSLINTLVLRCQLEPEEDFRALLAQVRETCLAAFAHQDVPLDYLVGRLRAQAQGAAVPELRVMFNVLNARREPVQLEGLDVRYLSFGLGATQFDLGLTVDIEGERALFLSYSTELFSAETAQALLDNYAHLLERLIASPDAPLQGVAVSSPGELALLASWNRTDVDYPREQTVIGLLSRHSGSDAVALRQLPGDSLRYAQLWSNVYRVAHALRVRGVQRGTRVGLCLERDPTLLIAQLAVLTAGAAYVPLDPAYPRQRLQDMALDAGLTLLLTREELAPLWDGLALPTMLLDSPVDAQAHPDTPPAPDAARDAGPEDAAYVIYTSGSTGKPKGVVVPHRAVVNFLLSMQAEPGLQPQDVLVAVTTLSFDISVLELLLPLAVGATVVLATREQTIDGLALSALLAQSQATVLQATPSTWQLLLETGWRGGPSFKALIGGESLSAHMARALSARVGDLWNMYGPTETTVWSTCWKVPGAVQGVSIGRPIANTRVHVLDAHGNPCPIGASGEMFIAGDGVTLGYFERPELTAERFVAEPIGAAPGARMYRTGDRGRWRRDGTLEHQGRLDFQVKVRGHRIELGEIEAQLQAHAAVSQCLVMAREDRPGDVRLVAYVVAADGTCDASALRDHLRATLPVYMLPQHFVELEALPLLPNGKINRHGLPPPGREARTHGETPQGHRSPAEDALSRVWADVLDLEPNDINSGDNFFDLGGDSLKVGRIVILFERKWGVRLESRRFMFESLSQLANGIKVDAAAAQPMQAAAAAKDEDGAGWWKRVSKIWR